MEDKKLIFSGIQPTGTFTLGNYIGAVRNWGPLQDEYNCIYCVVDMHAITVKQDPVKLRQSSLNSYALLMACGIDPEKSILFIQSHVKTHAELSWVLGCNTQFGELSRMTQFKDKSQRHPDDINSGLFTYPVLMAADILAYNADLVPVGVDQKQHLELARNIAQRFNQRYGDFFTLPEPYIPKVGAKVMSLQDPTKKMSKSDDNPNAVILILDDKDTIIRKFKRAVTDSETEVCYRDGKDGINNLMTIYSTVTGKDFASIESEFAGKGYGDFKLAVGEAVADHLEPVRTEFARLSKDKEYLKKCYTEGAEKALRYSQRILSKVYRKVGFVDKG
ncbi:MAG: tryptophan--tRNA ligase [Ruminococcus sp.]|nr:tryptophan--tRNA ligase [Ruminococcus sp.]MBO5320781.1 tryptophan--tRNA ligase [Ruminococcus sp.]MBQ4533833.1 tryptophan--tRNA ligase [Ruminococcus sp.]MBQ8180697.1 tryptophan--tRNA ligase [Ruminococcus sp.]MBR6623599.1 tryptophan--tRNA ligase [Ruminococcus sp.]